MMDKKMKNNKFKKIDKKKMRIVAKNALRRVEKKRKQGKK